MNCIGPTARSCTESPSSAPSSVSVMRAVPVPSSTGPRIGGADSPSVCSLAPPKRPWLDSTRPIAASSDQSMSQELGAPAAASRYASSAVSGMPLLVSPETGTTTATGFTVGALGGAAASAVVGAGAGAWATRGSGGASLVSAATDVGSAEGGGEDAEVGDDDASNDADDGDDVAAAVVVPGDTLGQASSAAVVSPAVTTADAYRMCDTAIPRPSPSASLPGATHGTAIRGRPEPRGSCEFSQLCETPGTWCGLGGCARSE